LSENLGINPEVFFDALREIKIFSFYGMSSVIEFLYDVGAYVCELGYQNTRLKKLLPEAPPVLDRVHRFYIERLLNALLEVSYNFTDADRGSIMLLDRETNELYIKVAKGLKRDVVEQTRLKAGESLAGVVMQEGKPLFIDGNTKDEKILAHLNNPQLRYSILIPIKGRDAIVGVLNVGTCRDDSDKFTTSSVETIDKLAELVETVLTNLSHVDVQ
ncbi:MAG: GAF domain-containing protein, partial [Candidatus Omnitrophota bacterium]